MTLNKHNDKYNNIDNAYSLIRGKWKYLILLNLSSKRMRFTELLRCTKNISQKVLNDNLKELESDELISKEYFYEYPPRVEYFLTSKGYRYANLIKQFDNLT